MQQGAEQTQPQPPQQPQQPLNQPTVLPTSPNARVQIQEVATDIPVPNDDAETDWNHTVEANGSPFRSQPAPTVPPRAQDAGVAQRQTDPRYLAPELLPPQTQSQSQPIPEIDPRPTHYCRDPCVEPQAHGALPTSYPTHIPGPTLTVMDEAQLQPHDKSLHLGVLQLQPRVALHS